MALGNRSFCAGAPSIVGGTFRKVSSSAGNLKPASLKAFPKSFSLGKSLWQVLQDVWYILANAGMAWLREGQARTAKRKQIAAACLNAECLFMFAPFSE